ncbi:pre-rRNA-processing protein SRD1 [Geosmithia morbida]|uniref:Pre-rRNA-processing protein SRD1 n=1 Tax=Geosmithia morbida TaxID=1094350 RepID=A0A9P4YYY1_9HYPO|nr:pre-rRNA-processing protein SRD1 [Geosmithia morbida]KAF4125646.1 pre-rRNA-processing protein SRD1 [Geosmithia morbida]
MWGETPRHMLTRNTTTEPKIQLRARPNPTIDLGAVDCSVSLTLCDLDLPDAPIIYASDGFCELTGYTVPEVLGRNPRFLQNPPPEARSLITSEDRAAIRRVSRAMAQSKEIQLPITNYKKDGQPFKNIMSIVPLKLGLGDEMHNYAVGLQCEV